MKNPRIVFFIGALVLVAIVYIAIPKKKESLKGPEGSSLVQGAAPETFHGIPPEGIGGDPDLNRMKNRWAAPQQAVPITITEIIALPHDALDRARDDHRRRWSRAAREQAEGGESRGVQVTGYLARVKEEGPEACNGRSDLYHDLHLWITESPGEDKSTGIIAELIPYWQEQHPAWQFLALDKLAFEHSKIRVTGWIMWDEEHSDEVGKSRGSCWEVHPVTKLEVFTNGAWKELAKVPV